MNRGLLLTAGFALFVSLATAPTALPAQQLRTLESHDDDIYSLAFSPDGRLLVSASGDETIRLWDPRTGAELRTLKGHTGPVYCVAFMPDGRTLASSAGDGTVRLWDVSTAQEKRTLKDQEEAVYCPAVSPDGAQ